MKNDHISPAGSLRQKAGELLKKNAIIEERLYSEADTRNLIHELEVHQVELELQNDELRYARAVAEIAVSRYADLYDFAPTGYFSLGIDSKIIDMNLCGAQLLGNDRSHLLDRHFQFFISEDTRPVFNAFLVRILNSKTRENCEVTITSEGKAPIYVHFDGMMIPNSEVYLLTAIDITGIKKANEILELTKQSYSDIINTVSEAIYIIDESGTFIDVNKGAEKMYLYEKSDLIGKTPSDVSAPGLNDLEKIQGRMQSVFLTGISEIFEFWGIRKNGEIFPKEVIVKKGHYFGKEVLVATARDITESKQAGALFQDIIDKNPMSIQIVDKEGCTVIGNPAYLRLFGAYPPPGFSIFTDLQNKSPELEKFILSAKRGEVVHLPDLYYNPHDVSSDFPDIRLWIRAIIFPLKDINGKPERFVFMHENITERKQAEIVLKKKSDELEQFNHLMIGREIKMIELKKEVNELLKKAGKEEKYKIHK